MAKILAVGTATIDRIFYVDQYPAENQELRANDYCTRRGGNVTNTLVVLSQFEHQCSWAGSWISQPESQVIFDELDRFDIDVSNTRQYLQGETPVSSVIVSNNGSRTITHYRDMPEFSFEDFKAIDLTRFDWIHFEGRNVEETEKMLGLVRLTVPECQVSIEIEKQRDNIDRLYPFADVLMFSETFANTLELTPEQLLSRVHEQSPDAHCICTQGSNGAIAISSEGVFVRAPAYAPSHVVDTLAAGDTFNAGIIDACLQECSLEGALDKACQLAGKKCGQTGLYDLNKSE